MLVVWRLTRQVVYAENQPVVSLPSYGTCVLEGNHFLLRDLRRLIQHNGHKMIISPDTLCVGNWGGTLWTLQVSLEVDGPFKFFAISATLEAVYAERTGFLLIHRRKNSDPIYSDEEEGLTILTQIFSDREKEATFVRLGMRPIMISLRQFFETLDPRYIEEVLQTK